MEIMKDKIFDNKFRVLSPLVHNGGMGEIYFVEDLKKDFNSKIIMKISKTEHINRFKKEIKIMLSLDNSPKIADILYSDLESDTPYYIMKFYKNGSLNNFYKDKLTGNFELQQKIFLEMIEGIQEIHSQNKFHRDIKPDNFLVDDNENIIVSDFGLSVDLSSTSKRITNTAEAYGTDGYYPPELSDNIGSFKYFDKRSDIYMLGKSFYALLSNNFKPVHIDKSKIDNFIYPIIDKACKIEKKERYENLEELKIALQKAFTYKLQSSPYEKAHILCQNDDLNMLEAEELYQLFLTLEIEEQKGILIILPISFFREIITEESIDLKYMLEVYKEIVEVDDPFNNWSVYTQSFMDNFRASMRFIITNKEYYNDEVKAISLYLLIIISEQRDEWACQGILKSLTDEDFIDEAVSLFLDNNAQNNDCLSQINPFVCQSMSIRKLINESKV